MFCEQSFSGDATERCLRPGGLELTQRGLALCGFPKRARIADIGCGAGASVRMLREQGYDCIGLDKSTQTGDFPHIQGTAEALPFRQESLHGILCECVLSLLHEPERVLKNFFWVCRVGGGLLLTDVYVKDNELAASGAFFSRREMDTALRSAGWHVTHFEDCSGALKKFAAHLLWHTPAPLPRSLCGKNGPLRACGYGLWIARKEG